MRIELHFGDLTELQLDLVALNTFCIQYLKFKLK